MPSPISPQTTRHVEKLLSRGVTQQRTALLAGVGVATVRRIAARLRAVPDHAQPEFEQWARSRARRCDGCGARVYVWPCLCCAIRAEREAEQDADSSESPASAPHVPQAPPPGLAATPHGARNGDVPCAATEPPRATAPRSAPRAKKS